MEILMLIMIFFLGTVFGSFFTLAVYRIPLGKDITHERSFCPKCNHRLEFLDLIPVWSYIFLGGKCRYCKEKVRPRYLILEILSGIVFLLIYLGLKIDLQGIVYLYLGVNFNNTIQKLIFLLAFIFFYITNAIIIGIDNEYKKINRKVLIFGIVTEAIYLIYLFIFSKEKIYGYGLYLLFAIIGLLLNEKNRNYIIENLIYLLYIFQFIDITNISIIMSFFIIIYTIYSLKICIKKNALNSEKSKINCIPIGFCLGISAIITELLIVSLN